MVSDLTVVTVQSTHNYFEVSWEVGCDALIVKERGSTIFYPLYNLVRFIVPKESENNV